MVTCNNESAECVGRVGFYHRWMDGTEWAKCEFHGDRALDAWEREAEMQRQWVEPCPERNDY